MWRIFSSIKQMTRKNWHVLLFFFCNWTHPLHTSLHFCSKQENPNLAVAYGFKHSDFWTLTWSVKRLALSFLPLFPKDGLSLWGGKEDERILRYLSGSEEGSLILRAGLPAALIWIFTGRTDAEAEAPILWPPNAKSQFIGKDPDTGKDWGQEETEVTQDEMVGWHPRTGVWANAGRQWSTGKPGVLQFMGSQRVRHNWATEQQLPLGIADPPVARLWQCCHSTWFWYPSTHELTRLFSFNFLRSVFIYFCHASPHAGS